ncbi:MAG: OmpH family outer membrane protein [Bdellovibrionales bacterium]|nr:OmpH family outer membrane protein [Bdellovibrionales bacterium]
MTRNKTALALLGLILVSFTATAAEVKIGFVDMQKAIQETAAGKKAKKELEADFNKKKKELEKKEADIKKMGEDFEKRSMAMNEDARMKKQGEIQMEMRKYQENAAKAQMDIQKRERELTQPIVTKLREILEGIAKKEDFTVILEKAENSVMWAKKEIDLTERLIKDYDSKK